MRKILLAACLLCALPTAALADADHRGVYLGPVVDLAAEFGGDKVATVSFTDGSTQNIRSGQGVAIAVGGHLRPYADSPWDFRATVGYKYVSTKATNADIHMDRVTLELMPSFRFAGPVWIGAGLVEHTAIKLHSDGFGPDLRFKPATGVDIALGWRPMKARVFDPTVAISYTVMRYRDELGNGYGANSFGVRFTAAFGWSQGSAPPRRAAQH